MPFQQLLKFPYQYFKNRNGIFRELQLNLRWEQWSNILIWELFENLPRIKYFQAYVINRSIGPTIKIILSVQDSFYQTFATVRWTFGMTASSTVFQIHNQIGGVMVSLVASSAVDCESEPRSGHTKDYKIGNCCFSSKHAALRRKSKDRFTLNQDDVSECGNMSTRGLLFQWASTIKIQLSVLV